MDYFTIPIDAEISISALAHALADQLQIIVHEPDSDIDVIASNYQLYLSEPETENTQSHKPLYTGDEFWVETPLPERRHIVDFYEHFTHTWKLLNSGKVTWMGRKLVCKNSDNIIPYALQQSVDIPDTAPNGRVAISVEFDARGSEDTYISEWIMVDGDNKDCYLKHSSPLNVTIVVENKMFDRTGGKKSE